MSAGCVQVAFDVLSSDPTRGELEFYCEKLRNAFSTEKLQFFFTQPAAEPRKKLCNCATESKRMQCGVK